MSDLPLQSLFEQLQARRVPGEHLEVLGKQAAADWCDGRHTTLTDAVISSVKHAGLSAEQVRRVVEFTNTEAFNVEFRKQGSVHRVVSFAGGPADASTIIKDLNSGGGSSVHDRGLSDYHTPPTTKISSAMAEKALLSSFMSREVVYPTENPYAEAFELRDKLSSVHSQMTSELSGLELMYGDLKEYLFNEVKQAALSGTSLGEIVQAWEGVTPAPKDQFIKSAFLFLAPRLLENGVFRSGQQMQGSLEKVGHSRSVNHEHPLLTYYTEYCECLSKMAEARAARDSISEPLFELNTFIRKQAADEGAQGPIPSAWRGYKKLVDATGQHVGEFAHHAWHGGDSPMPAKGNVVSKGIGLAGKVLLPAVAAKGLYDNYVRDNPLYQAASNTVSPMIPGTQQYYGGYGY